MSIKNFGPEFKELLAKEGKVTEFKKDTEPHNVPQPVDLGRYPDLPQPVQNFVASFKHRNEETVKEVLAAAEYLENYVAELKRRAATLALQADNIPKDIRESVAYERESATLAQRLLSSKKQA